MASAAPAGRRSPWSRPRSLAGRLVLGGSAVLLLFVAALGAILEAAVRDSLEAAARQRLQAHVFTLLAVVDVAADGTIRMPEVLPEPRFNRPDSGLYADMIGRQDHWLSVSALGENPELPHAALAPGETRFLRRQDIGPELAYVFRQGIAWESAEGAVQDFVLSVAEHARSVDDPLATFRRTLWAWMGTAVAALLALQLAVLRWGLRPLRRLAAELAAVKRGDRGVPGSDGSDAIGQDVPRELIGLAGGLNAFIASERKHLERYRNSLSDLAHSLKTPLAVLRSGLERDDPEALLPQVDRMDELVAYQLKRARSAGHATLSGPESVAAALEPLLAALDKVHAERRITFERDVDPEARFFGDRADLLELLGNLLDNACKWADAAVLIVVRARSSSPALRPGLLVRIEDDGPGIAAAEVDRVCRRGVRADERVPGHGIGLAIVADICDAYGGRLAFERSSLGGAAAVLSFPER